MWIKKIINVVEYRHFFMLFGFFFISLVVFSIHLAITMRKNLKRLNRKKKGCVIMWSLVSSIFKTEAGFFLVP